MYLRALELGKMNSHSFYQEKIHSHFSHCTLYFQGSNGPYLRRLDVSTHSDRLVAFGKDFKSIFAQKMYYLCLYFLCMKKTKFQSKIICYFFVGLCFRFCPSLSHGLSRELGPSATRVNGSTSIPTSSEITLCMHF